MVMFFILFEMTFVLHLLYSSNMTSLTKIGHFLIDKEIPVKVFVDSIYPGPEYKLDYSVPALKNNENINYNIKSPDNPTSRKEST